jgi:hypothetical protein
VDRIYTSFSRTQWIYVLIRAGESPSIATAESGLKEAICRRLFRSSNHLFCAGAKRTAGKIP